MPFHFNNFKNIYMKTLYLMLTTGILFLSFSSQAQVSTNENEKSRTPKPIVVTKGYYSIGNNSEKLSRPTSWEVTGESYPKVQKGYFSIGDNNRKLAKQLVIRMDRRPSRPVTTKGYYSISGNSEKTRQD
jgi:hypothetical protein